MNHACLVVGRRVGSLVPVRFPVSCRVVVDAVRYPEHNCPNNDVIYIVGR